MTQLEALKVAYNELSNMMPYDEENDEVFEAANVIEKMIKTKEKAMYRRELKNQPRSKADRKHQKDINDMFDDLLSSM